MILQPIVDIAEICAQKQVHNFILSPGSRCAPLTIALARHPALHTRTVSDERSAAFIALGMAQATQATVGLVCTSGTAALNYAPAVAEAYYQQVPLLILTADRPPEWIEQQDGQTIRQQELYGKHVKAFYDLPADYAHPDAVWHINRVLNEAINLSQTEPKGPVHINVPLREPFYPSEDEILEFDSNSRIIEEIKSESKLSRHQLFDLVNEWLETPKKLIVVGQTPYDEDLINALYACQYYNNVPIVGDVISNIHKVENVITHQDLFLAQKDEAQLQALQPTLLVTIGNSVISKNLKLFLRKYKPQKHWHIQTAGKVADPFQSITHVIRVNAVDFIIKLGENGFFNDPNNGQAYKEAWQQANGKVKNHLQTFFNNKPFSEFEAVAQIHQQIPDGSMLHLANSMPVRYANFINGLPPRVKVFANRGTSGIDGSTSTAVGSALVTEQLVTLISGDMAFFYDRNALWNNFVPPNLRIIVLNNHGGGIFNMIDGPSKQPELSTYFVTEQKLQAESTAREFGLAYQRCTNADELRTALPLFFAADGQAKLLEIETDITNNTAVFKQFKQAFLG